MDKRPYQNYTDEDIIKFSSEVTNMANLLKKVGLKPHGGNYDTMRKRLQLLNLTCDHWTGQAWSKNQQLKDWTQLKGMGSKKKYLISERGHLCENCNNSEWLGFEIPLELEHIDGDRTNNEPENLKLFCCNCHALTPTWRGRKNKEATNACPFCFVSIASTSKTCSKCINKGKELPPNPKNNRSNRTKTCVCGKMICEDSKTCVKCHHNNRTIKNKPNKETLYNDVWTHPTSSLVEKYNVSDNTISKWCKSYDIEKPARGYWTKKLHNKI